MHKQISLSRNSIIFKLTITTIYYETNDVRDIHII